MNKKKKLIEKAANAAINRRKKEEYEKKEWYTARGLLGNQWANWFLMIGARER